MRRRRRWQRRKGYKRSTGFALMLDDASAMRRSRLVGRRDLQALQEEPAPAPPKTPPTPHLHSPASQAPLGAGGQFGSQCKYIFSLSKTHFPTTVNGEEGALEGGGLREEGVGVKFSPSSSPPFSPPLSRLPLPAGF